MSRAILPLPQRVSHLVRSGELPAGSPGGLRRGEGSSHGIISSRARGLVDVTPASARMAPRCVPSGLGLAWPVGGGGASDGPSALPGAPPWHNSPCGERAVGGGGGIHRAVVGRVPHTTMARETGESKGKSIAYPPNRTWTLLPQVEAPNDTRTPYKMACEHGLGLNISYGGCGELRRGHPGLGLVTGLCLGPR